MKRSAQFCAVFCLTTFIAGTMFACQSESTPNPDSCFANEGDQTCAELYGDERPFCAAATEGCGPDESYHGCVAEPPPDECYSPCGADTSCSPTAEEQGDGDGDGDTSGDTDGESAGDGDGDTGPVCGDGFLDDDEECDDGNTINDDDCSNTCHAPICGDGIVQASLGETCDDGDTVGGDGCASSCVLPGTVLWSRLSDLPSATGRAVAVAGNGNIGVIAFSGGLGNRIICLDPNGDVLWNEEAPPQAARIAVGPSNEFVTAGVVDGKGQVWRFDPDGGLTWTAQVPLAPTSKISDIAVDDAGAITSVGVANGLGLLMRHSAAGQLQFMKTVNDTPSFDRVAVASDGSAWVLHANPRRISHYDTSSELVWTSEDLSAPEFIPPMADLYADLAVDVYGNAYVVGNVSNAYERFAIINYDSDGDRSWVSYHDDPGVWEAGGAVVALPNGGAVVAGLTNSDLMNPESDALLSWYGPDGLGMGDARYDGAQDDDFDVFTGVAVGPDSNLAVVGSHEVGGASQLWMLKIAM